MTDRFESSAALLGPEIRLLLQALSDYANLDDATGLLEEPGTRALETIEQALKGRETSASEDLSTLLARVRLGRFQSLPEGQDRDDLKACLKWFARVRRTNPDRVPQSVREALDESDYDESWEESRQTLTVAQATQGALARRVHEHSTSRSVNRDYPGRRVNPNRTNQMQVTRMRPARSRTLYVTPLRLSPT
jgi:hypothetical protein